MGFLDNLNFLATIGTFACVSFALSGMGVKLGKLSSDRHQLGFKYISEIGDQNKIDKLYAATAKLNEKFNNNAPTWAKDPKKLSDWCNKYQKSTRKLGENSHHCILQNKVWHKLIEKGFDVTEPEAQTTAGESGTTQTNQDKCSYEILNKYSDDENDINSLIGRKLCPKGLTGEATQAQASNSAQIGSAGIQSK